MTDEELTQLNERLNTAAKDLTEYFDSVRIFVTIRDSDETGSFTRSATTGYGNFWASVGYISHWVAKQKEASRMEAREGASPKDDKLNEDEYSDWSRG